MGPFNSISFDNFKDCFVSGDLICTGGKLRMISGEEIDVDRDDWG